MKFIRALLFSVPCALLMFLTQPCMSQPIKMTPEFQAAMQLLAQGNYEKAIEALNPLMASPQHQASALIEAGKIKSRQAENQMAIARSNYLRAAELLNGGILSGGVSDIEMPKTMYDLAKLYEEKLQNYPEATELYTKIIQEYPNFLSIDKVYYNLAVCQEKMGLTGVAAENYRKIVADYAYSSHFEAAKERMKATSTGTQTQESALDTQEALAESTYGEQESKTALDLGDMQAGAGKYSQAVESYRRAVESANDQNEAVEAYKKLIKTLDEKQKDYEAAAQATEELLSKYPDAAGIEEITYRLGRIYEQDLEALKTTVVDGSVRYRKSTENIKKAIGYYDTVTNQHPDADVSANAYLRKAELYERDLHDYDRAKEAYEDFLKNFPQHRRAPKIREKLKELKNY